MVHLTHYELFSVKEKIGTESSTGEILAQKLKSKMRSKLTVSDDFFNPTIEVFKEI